MIKKLISRIVIITFGGAFCATYAMLLYLGSSDSQTKFTSLYFVGVLLGFMAGYFCCSYFVISEGEHAKGN